MGADAGDVEAVRLRLDVVAPAGHAVLRDGLHSAEVEWRPVLHRLVINHAVGLLFAGHVAEKTLRQFRRGVDIDGETDRPSVDVFVVVPDYLRLDAKRLEEKHLLNGKLFIDRAEIEIPRLLVVDADAAVGVHHACKEGILCLFGPAEDVGRNAPVGLPLPTKEERKLLRNGFEGAGGDMDVHVAPLRPAVILLDPIFPAIVFRDAQNLVAHVCFIKAKRHHHRRGIAPVAEKQAEKPCHVVVDALRHLAVLRPDAFHLISYGKVSDGGASLALHGEHVVGSEDDGSPVVELDETGVIRRRVADKLLHADEAVGVRVVDLDAFALHVYPIRLHASTDFMEHRHLVKEAFGALHKKPAANAESHDLISVVASHRGHLRVGNSGLVVLEIKRSVQKFPVRKQTFRRDFHRQLKQVMIRVAIVVVDTILHLEDLYGENRSFPMPKPRLCGKQNTPDNKPLLFSRPRTIVNGRERNLRSGT